MFFTGSLFIISVHEVKSLAVRPAVLLHHISSHEILCELSKYCPAGISQSLAPAAARHVANPQSTRENVALLSNLYVGITFGRKARNMQLQTCFADW